MYVLERYSYYGCGFFMLRLIDVIGTVLGRGLGHPWILAVSCKCMKADGFRGCRMVSYT